MKKMLIVIFLLFTCSCTFNRGVVMLTDTKYPAKYGDYNIEILFEEPAKPYKKIAIVDVVGESGNETLEELIRELKKVGRKISADAIILGKYSEEASSGKAILIPVGNSLSIISTSGSKTRVIGYAIIWE